jgi:predicted permease
MADLLRKDLRFAIRQLRRNPGFTVTAIIVLSLGVCASLAIFAFVDAALIQPLPYRDPARLVGVFERIAAMPRSNLSYADYLDWKRLNTVFTSMDMYNRSGFQLSTKEGAEPVRGARVSSGFFRTLGVAPVAGRDFHDGEDMPGAQRVAMISYGVWQARYGGRADVLGTVVTLDGEPNTIVGVLPRDFHFAPAEPADFWTAFHAVTGCDIRRGCHGLYGVARLKDVVSIETALANVTSIAQALEKQYPDSNRGQGASLATLTDVIVGNIRPVLLVLLSGAGLLLLIASVNVAGLLLVRSESRQREIAVRTALGASSGRLLRQFVTEAVVLGGAASALGMLSSHWVIHLLRGLISERMLSRMPFLRELGWNPRLIALALAISLGAILLLSLPPSLRIRTSRIGDGLAQSARGSSGVVWRKLGSKLVVLELATAMVLLVGAGLLGKSLFRLLHVALGIEPEHLISITVDAPESRYNGDEQAIALARQVVRRAEELPGVRSVGFASLGIPLGGNSSTTSFRIAGRPWNGEHNEAPYRKISPAYLATLGAKLLRGRAFTEADDANRPLVAIINQAFVRVYFPGEEPVGRQIAQNSAPAKPIEIVGVVEDIREGPLDAAIPPVLYLPFYQSTDPYFDLVVRASQRESSLLPVLASMVRQIDRGIVTYNGARMAERIDNSESAYLHRSAAYLVGGFASVALLLGVVGLYGVTAYSVTQRNREIGIRMALGAAPGSVYRMILQEAGWLTIVGVLAGVILAIAGANLMRGVLFGVRAWDVPTIAAVAGVFGAAALLASFLPARRAAAVNPVEALRAE